jgi:predicted TIM-barrel fold metal-dependent hydrolase
MNGGIIDFHAHIFPDELAERAIKQLAGRSGETAFTDGTAAGRRASMRKPGISRSVIQHVSTRAKQTLAINDYSIALNSEDLISFGTIHPDHADPAAEIARMKAAGIKGVKFHPDYQVFYADEDRMLPVYRMMAEAKLIALFHAGVDIGLEAPYHGNPDRIARLLELVPDLVVVAAHFGGFQVWEDVDRHLIGKNVYLDTSFTLSFLAREDFVRMARAHGIGRVLFGTDTPWADQGVEIELMRNSGLSAAELRAVFHDNAARLLKI